MMNTGKKSLQRLMTEAERLTHVTVEELADEARKMRALAEDELRIVVGTARVSGQARLKKLGRQLVKLGHRVEKVGVPKKGTAGRRRRPARTAAPASPRV
jgi:hypothetical protein